MEMTTCEKVTFASIKFITDFRRFEGNIHNVGQGVRYFAKPSVCLELYFNNKDKVVMEM